MLSAEAERCLVATTVTATTVAALLLVATTIATLTCRQTQQRSTLGSESVVAKLVILQQAYQLHSTPNRLACAVTLVN